MKYPKEFLEWFERFGYAYADKHEAYEAWLIR